MKLRRSLAMAAAVAVATPVALFAASPALAAGTSVTQTQNQPTYAELAQAVDDAKKAYEDAVIAKEEGQKKVQETLRALDSDTHPLKAAALAAAEEAKEASAAQAAADKAVTEAEAALEAAEGDTEKAEARQALEAAESVLAGAVEAKRKADTAAEKAGTALDDARVAAAREYSLVQNAPAETLKVKKAAEEALAAAKECVREDGLTSLATGLPSKVVAGSTTDITLRVTNGTARTLTVDPLVFFHVEGEGKGAEGALTVEWSNGSGWQTLDGTGPEQIAHVDAMKPGEQREVKLRMKVDSAAGAAGAADAFALFAADASDVYNPCVLGPMKRYDFQLLPAGSKPGPAEEAKPGLPGDDDTRPGAAKPGTEAGHSAQGESSKKPTATGTGTGTAGNLAETGTSPAMASIALAGGVTLALGAGAVITVRRRKATGTA
ncbi:hypothetical protein [Streptomyces sp. NRRL WC-3549]|uniref:hypothetical protein n=1 Tax=Streptomyces sp. NRRL WC-3549 TaxID=1463925 RepID=UPI0004C98A9D|nr:hypothetical protein [Streptomyces sp. NRRL WC-3549]